MKIGSPIPRKKSRIEIIPLIDIMFFLLVSFMLVSLSMIRLQSIKMDLPTAMTARRDRNPDIFNLAVDKIGDAYIGSDRIPLLDLPGILTNKIAANSNLAVYISGDRQAAHGSVINVLDLVRRAGIQRVSFAIAPTNETRPKP